MKDAALWLREKRIDYWQGWLDPPVEFVNWIEDGFKNNEIYLIYQADEAIGCFRLQWSDELFWGQRNDASGYVDSFITVRRLAGQKIGEHALALIEEFCRQHKKRYLRMDCGTHIVRLCQYYEAQGFQKVGEVIVHGECLALYEKSIMDSDAETIRLP